MVMRGLPRFNEWLLLLTTPVDDFEYVDEVDVRGRRARIKLWGLTAAG
jgi:hypothetical protein